MIMEWFTVKMPFKRPLLPEPADLPGEQPARQPIELTLYYAQAR